MELTPEQQASIQGIGLAGFRKDYQHSLFVRFNDAGSAQRLLTATQDLVASHTEVSAFNAAYSEILKRTGREDVIDATWVGLLLSASGYRKLGVDLGKELPGQPGYEAFKEGMLVYEEEGATLPGNSKGHEHFGFKDGVSQPTVAGIEPEPKPGEPPAIPLGEFVLGYQDAAGSSASVGSLWQNGSFVVFERIRQNVVGFRTQAAKAAEGSNSTLTPAAMEAKMVGRWPSGTPLETSPESDPGESGVTNAFEYAAAPYDDGEGTKTPRFAHIRKANPRDETRPDLEDPVSRHRMIRRGIPFGPMLPDGATTDDSAARGLHFFCYVADIARQFEFVQSKWLNDGNFPNGGVPPQPGGPYTPPTSGEPPDGPDPVVGEHDAGAEVALHTSQGVHSLALGAEVVSITAGTYFFAPSLTAIGQLAAGATASAT
jgi:Dyp-type peroxidase family